MSLLPFLLSTVACVPPTDDAEGGTSTYDDADDDGDGLTNGEEDDLGSDPNEVDSDGDGYSDFDEVETGHDPTDDDDKIYEGGWPYNPNKDEMEDPGWDGRAKEGEVVPRFQSYDHFGDDFDLYDFAGHGKSVIIDISAEWCGYCQELAKYMGSQASYFDQYESSYPELKKVRKGIENGEILWVEILDQNQAGTTIELRDLEQWEKRYGMPFTPVVADEEMLWLDWTKLRGYPTLMLADETMTITSYSASDYFAALGDAAALLDE